MTILLREVAGFLIGAASWVLIVGAIGWLAANASALALRRRGDRRLWLTALIGAAVGAALAHRLAIPSPWSPEVGGRPLPVTEAAVGGLLAGFLHLRAGRLGSGAPAAPDPNGQHQG